jgi:Fur family ferric uptake transcriptional regulator
MAERTGGAEGGSRLRVDLGGQVARFEPARADGEHHHHAVCRECGGVTPIGDDALEKALHGMADRLSFEVDAHDITLHGRCAACAGSDSPTPLNAAGVHPADGA